MRSRLIFLFVMQSVLSTVVHRGGSCGKDAIPYKITVDGKGRPELHCDSPICIGRGSRGDARASCEKDFSTKTVCTARTEWTAGLIETSDGTSTSLRTLCCSFAQLREAKELQTVILNENGHFEGGAVERHGRMVAFDLVKEVRKTVDEDGSVRYLAAIYRMPCVDSSEDSEDGVEERLRPMKLHRVNRKWRHYRRRFDDYDDYDPSPRVRISRHKKPWLIDAPAAQFGQNSYADETANVPATVYRQPGHEGQASVPAAPTNYATSQVQPYAQIAPSAPSSYPTAPVYYPVASSSCTSTPSCSASPSCSSNCCCGGGGGGALGGLRCFSGAMLVETENGQKKISELQRGDRVLSIDERLIQFSPIIMHLHKMDNVSAEFYDVQLEGGHSVELTADHLIYRSDCAPRAELHLVHAKDLQVGQCLDATSNRGRHTQRSKIVAIGKVVRSGVYAPLTSTGNIFVNGVLASCHSNYGLKSLQQSFFSVYRKAQWAYESLFRQGLLSQYEVPFGVEYLSNVFDLFVPKHLH